MKNIVSAIIGIVLALPAALVATEVVNPDRFSVISLQQR